MLLLKLSEGTAARRRIPFRMVDADGAAVTGISFAAADIKVSKNGAAEGNSGGSDTEIAGGLYYYEATAGELDTLGFVTLRATGAGAGVAVAVAQVVSFDPYDAVRAGLTALPNAAADAAGGLPISDAGGLDLDAQRADVAAILVDTGTTLDGKLDTIDDFLDLEVAAIKAKTDNLPADPADASDLAALIDALPTAAENATGLLDAAAGVETGLTVRQALRLIAAVLYGKVSGGGTATNTFRDTGDAKNRVVSTVDASGNRTAVVLDAS